MQPSAASPLSPSESFESHVECHDSEPDKVMRRSYAPSGRAPSSLGDEPQPHSQLKRRCLIVPAIQNRYLQDVAVVRQPLTVVKQEGRQNAGTVVQYYAVLYTKHAPHKVGLLDQSFLHFHVHAFTSFHPAYVFLQANSLPQKRKNKSFSDGVLEVKDSDSCYLYDEVYVCDRQRVQL
jgi:hypothetical protein